MNAYRKDALLTFFSVGSAGPTYVSSAGALAEHSQTTTQLFANYRFEFGDVDASPDRLAQLKTIPDLRVRFSFDAHGDVFASYQNYFAVITARTHLRKGLL